MRSFNKLCNSLTDDHKNQDDGYCWQGASMDFKAEDPNGINSHTDTVHSPTTACANNKDSMSQAARNRSPHTTSAYS